MGRKMKYFNEKTDEFVGTIRVSKHHGPYKVIGMINSFTYTIQFLWSTCIRNCEKRNIINNAVRDPWQGINPNIIQYSNNYGPFIIEKITYDKKDNNEGNITKFHIKFIETGTQKDVIADRVINGAIKDENATHISVLDTCVIQPNMKIRRLNRYRYTIYTSMMNRCYDINNSNYYRYGGNGITVDERWHNMNNFFDDMQYIQFYNKWERYPNLYQLDKDYKQMYLPSNKRKYSINTCLFLHKNDNINLRTIENTKNKYYGVYYANDRNKYRVEFSIDSLRILIGYYDSEIFAAAVYNYYYRIYHPYELIPLLNEGVDIYTEKEILEASNHRVQMYSVIGKDIDSLDELNNYIEEPKPFSKYYSTEQYLKNREFEHFKFPTYEI